MFIYALLYAPGTDEEGIHSLEIQGSTVVLMFEDIDDAERYCGLLEAQDFPRPTVEKLDKKEIEEFCAKSGYDSKFIPLGFVPETDEDRLFLLPPQLNKDVNNWQDERSASDSERISPENLNQIKNQLEELL